MKKIALEEHFWTEGFPHTGKAGADLFEPWFLRLIDERLGELSELRIAAMDAAGIDVSVLSLISPGVQIERDAARAVSAAQKSQRFSRCRDRQTPDPLCRICASADAGGARGHKRARALHHIAQLQGRADQWPQQWRLSRRC